MASSTPSTGTPNILNVDEAARYGVGTALIQKIFSAESYFKNQPFLQYCHYGYDFWSHHLPSLYAAPADWHLNSPEGVSVNFGTNQSFSYSDFVNLNVGGLTTFEDLMQPSSGVTAGNPFFLLAAHNKVYAADSFKSQWPGIACDSYSDPYKMISLAAPRFWPDDIEMSLDDVAFSTNSSCSRGPTFNSLNNYHDDDTNASANNDYRPTIENAPNDKNKSMQGSFTGAWNIESQKIKLSYTYSDNVSSTVTNGTSTTGTTGHEANLSIAATAEADLPGVKVSSTVTAGYNQTWSQANEVNYSKSGEIVNGTSLTYGLSAELPSTLDSDQDEYVLKWAGTNTKGQPITNTTIFQKGVEYTTAITMSKSKLYNPVTGSYYIKGNTGRMKWGYQQVANKAQGSYSRVVSPAGHVYLTEGYQLITPNSNVKNGHYKFLWNGATSLAHETGDAYGTTPGDSLTAAEAISLANSFQGPAVFGYEPGSVGEKNAQGIQYNGTVVAKTKQSYDFQIKTWPTLRPNDAVISTPDSLSTQFLKTNDNNQGAEASRNSIKVDSDEKTTHYDLGKGDTTPSDQTGVAIEFSTKKGERSVIRGTGSYDLVNASQQGDHLFHNFSNSQLYGNDRGDTFKLGVNSSRNSIHAGKGNDKVIASSPQSADLGSGHDQYIIKEGYGHHIELGTGRDEVRLRSKNISFSVADYDWVDDKITVSNGMDSDKLTAELHNPSGENEDHLAFHMLRFFYDGEAIGQALFNVSANSNYTAAYSPNKSIELACLNASEVGMDVVTGMMSGSDDIYTAKEFMNHLLIESGLFKKDIITHRDWSNMSNSNRSDILFTIADRSTILDNGLSSEDWKDKLDGFDSNETKDFSISLLHKLATENS
ncbi:hypothetical protein PMIT1342_00285 [Prochlorococcus marinus str. MIT 1342]|uniref:hypothetical protein n=1 Tax=Prochlorococcus TaxID=1218 RepID=UPI0007BB82B1|nr:hypothetical protein [Prochlorococcus marinus]KZR83494.1 hypothetical protein PMIT1342_00285 [Prochlorococcus marinus str. MIT 1342]